MRIAISIATLFILIIALASTKNTHHLNQITLSATAVPSDLPPNTVKNMA